MNQMMSKWPIWAAVLVAAASLSYAAVVSARHRQARDEVQTLRGQIARMQAQVPNPDAEPRARSRNRQERDEFLQSFDVDEGTNPTGEAASQDEESGERRRESFEERMARMQQEDPEGYAEMIQRRAERQEQMKYNMATRAATLMELDTSLMNRRELENHELLVSKMADIWALTEQMQDPEAAPDRETWRTMGTLMQEVRPLLQEERNTMFKMLGSQLGYNNADAKQFAGEIQAILDATSLGSMPRGGGRGGGDRR